MSSELFDGFFNGYVFPPEVIEAIKKRKKESENEEYARYAAMMRYLFDEKALYEKSSLTEQIVSPFIFIAATISYMIPIVGVVFDIIRETNAYQAPEYLEDLKLTQQQIQEQGIRMQNPIPDIVKRTELSEQYSYLLKRNRLETLISLNSGTPPNAATQAEIALLQKELNYFKEQKQRSKERSEWLPYFLMPLGSYPPNEIKEIFNSLTLSRRKALIQNAMQNPNFTSISDPHIIARIRDLATANDDIDFNYKLTNLNLCQIGNLSGGNILLGLCDIQTFENIQKEQIEENLRMEYQKPELKRAITLAGLNQYVQNKIHPPRGIATFESVSRAFGEYPITPQNFESLDNADRYHFLPLIWSADGLTHPIHEGKIQVDFTMRPKRWDSEAEPITNTIIHENYHALIKVMEQKGSMTALWNFFDAVRTGRILEYLQSSGKDVPNSIILIHQTNQLKHAMEEMLASNLESFYPGIGAKLKDKNIASLLEHLGIKRTSANQADFDAFILEMNAITSNKAHLLKSGSRDVANLIPNIEDPFTKIYLALRCENQGIIGNPVADELRDKLYAFLNNKNTSTGFTNKEIFEDYCDFFVEHKISTMYDHHDIWHESHETLARILPKLPRLALMFPGNKLIDDIKTNLEYDLTEQAINTAIPTVWRSNLRASKYQEARLQFPNGQELQKSHTAHHTAQKRKPVNISHSI